MLRFEKKSIWYRLTTLIHHEFNPFFSFIFHFLSIKVFPFRMHTWRVANFMYLWEEEGRGGFEHISHILQSRSYTFRVVGR